MSYVRAVAGDNELRLNDVLGDDELYMDFFIYDGMIYVVNPIETFELIWGGEDRIVTRGFDQLLFQMKLYDDIYYEGELVRGSVQYELPEALLNQKFSVNYWIESPEGVSSEVQTKQIIPKVHGIEELALTLPKEDIVEGTWEFHTQLALNGVAKNDDYTEFEVKNHIMAWVLGSGIVGVVGVILFVILT